MANKVLRIILIIVLFVIFFEIGLVSSYTIVTSEAPNVQGLIDMQISKITGIFNPAKVNDMLIKDATHLNITNKKDVALKMESLSKVDGVNVDSMNVTTYDNPDKKNFTVTIEALGYESPNSSSGQIVISKIPSYKIIAKANATYKDSGLTVNENSIVINSVLKLYNTGSSSSTGATSYTNYSKSSSSSSGSSGSSSGSGSSSSGYGYTSYTNYSR
ncbi:hypothetical protein [Methanobrevibacter sp.]|uniref:hypothetical protein n=1 Tax=Methanobrevibacter sp. TaxID=66852 RepID=UPI002E75C15B|nr:hypothetical protein [Methanobrevibacter sp.]MEE0940144.1 hypothetical protein [Methanobrevibacter sp.]